MSKFRLLIVLLVNLCLTTGVAVARYCKDSSLLPRTTLNIIPTHEALLKVRLRPIFAKNSGRPTLTVKEFRHLLRTARILKDDDRLIDNWNYAPWYKGEMVTATGKFRFDLYYGGMIRFVTPRCKQAYALLNNKQLNLVLYGTVEEFEKQLEANKDARPEQPEIENGETKSTQQDPQNKKDKSAHAEHLPGSAKGDTNQSGESAKNQMLVRGKNLDDGNSKNQDNKGVTTAPDKNKNQNENNSDDSPGLDLYLD